uniref:Cytochrome P450 89A2 n=1 Tax=Oryza brachyantha TaxID=4533 RepID=J3N412_ORYBR
MAVGSSLPCDSPPLLLSFAIMVATVLCVFGRLRASKRPWNWKWNTAAVSRDAVLRLVGIRLGDVRTVVVRDGAVAHEFLSFLSKARVFGTFQKVARLVYRDRWKKLVHYRRRQQEMYLPLIRARKEQRRTQGTTSPSSSSTAYVDTLLDLEVPAADGEAGRRKLTEGEMVGLVSEYLGATTGTVLAELEYILANLILRPDVQSRLRAERHMGCDVVLGDDTHAAQGSVVSFAIEEIGRDNEIWASAQEFRPERFMPGGEGEGVRLALGSKHQEEATKVVKMMPFGAGRRRCPGMGYAMLHLEYFLASLVAAFEWRRAPGEDGEVDLTADYGFITAMQRPLRALVVPRTPPANARSCVGVAVN